MIRAICSEYRISCLFVWQPHPGYKYNRALHRTFPFVGAVPQYFQQVFARMEQHTEADYLFLGDMLLHEQRKVFVDDVHYSDVFNER